jgi:CDGSH-type Zn-finger protein
MSREVNHDANNPAIIDEEEFEEQGGTIAICQCGLSNNKPYCDGSHNSTLDEEEGEKYKYEEDDDENQRHEIEEIVFEEK